MKHFSYLLLLVFIYSCGQKENLYHLPTFSKNNVVQAVIEIPAGTNKKYEFNEETLSFEIDKRDGVERTIEFLPYPGNYGFIPSTLSNTNAGGDGDALDVLIISETLPTGTILEIMPLGVLKLIDNNEFDYKIIAIPNDKKLQTIKANTFLNFTKSYPKSKEILELWFTSYDKKDSLYIESWGDEKEAFIEINKSL